MSSYCANTTTLDCRNPCPVPEPVVDGAQAYASSSCCSVTFVDESAEDRSSPDRHSHIDHPVWLVARCLLLSAMRRSMLVVVRLPIGEYATVMLVPCRNPDCVPASGSLVGICAQLASNRLPAASKRVRRVPSGGR